MTVADLSPTQLISVGALASAFIAAFLGIVVYIMYRLARIKGWFGFNARRDRAAEALRDFSDQVRTLEQKQRLLGAYASEYFNTLQAAGWEEVVTLVDNLRSVEGALQIMFDQGRYLDVSEVCDYLARRLSPEEAVALEAAYDGLSSLANWKADSRNLLLRVIEATTASARQTHELGIKRVQRNRKPTLVSLADLRGSLGEL